VVQVQVCIRAEERGGEHDLCVSTEVLGTRRANDLEMGMAVLLEQRIKELLLAAVREGMATLLSCENCLHSCRPSDPCRLAWSAEKEERL